MLLLKVVSPVGFGRCGQRLVLRTLLRPQLLTPELSAAISSKANMGDYERKKPFPYKEKRFTLFHHLYDKTTHRLDENSKIVVVDGPIAAGKSTFAKQLAEDLDMMYSPEATMDRFLINDYGYDRRAINKEVPERCQAFDVKDFYANPKSPNSGVMQTEMMIIRSLEYCDALAHVLNTGQGVVLDRSIYSDFVFMEAMFEAGYVSKVLKEVYDEIYTNLKYFLLRPHLVIYLDVPVDEVKKRIKKRNNEWECKSSVLTDSYLNSIERNYKQKFLKSICQHAEVMVYDWSNFGDVEVVVEDIERIDFERGQKYDEKQMDWKFEFERDWFMRRSQYTNESMDLVDACFPTHFIPELTMYTEDSEKFHDALMKIPGEEFQPGFNPKLGDNVMFKS